MSENFINVDFLKMWGVFEGPIFAPSLRILKSLLKVKRSGFLGFFGLSKAAYLDFEETEKGYL